MELGLQRQQSAAAGRKIEEQRTPDPCKKIDELESKRREERKIHHFLSVKGHNATRWNGNPRPSREKKGADEGLAEVVVEAWKQGSLRVYQS